MFHSVLPLLAASVLAVQPARSSLQEAPRRPDAIDSIVKTQMARREIAGLTLAVIDRGRVMDVRYYGTTTRGGTDAVTRFTLFQAGSISKPVAALAALQMVERGALSLDDNVNDKLRSWRVPENEFTQQQPVTLRGLLSHTAGLTVHGFPGYAVGERVPSIPDILDGRGNTGAVRVNVVPGSVWRYSGGGYTVMQQLVTDLSDLPFADYLRDQVLVPLGMRSSSFAQPLPAAMAALTATGHRLDRQPVPGRWHVYPEMAAAGLWTTAAELAQYATEVQRIYAGTSRVLSRDMGQQMLTDQKDGHGLGPAVAGSGATLRFHHNGRDDGFDASLVAYARTGQGAVVMINANDNSRAVNRIIDAIARARQWPDWELPQPEAVTRAPNASSLLKDVSGRYEFQNNFMLTLFVQDGTLFTDVNGLRDEDWIPATDGRLVSGDRAVSFTPVRDASGKITGILWTSPNGTTRQIPRIGPLFSTTTTRDPDAAFTARFDSARVHLAAGGAAVAGSPLLTSGARSAFTRPTLDFANVTARRFVMSEDVRGRGIERHGHAIARVAHYRLSTGRGERLVIVHVDAEGRVADFDVVNR
ncbi:MAG TPA: serine hydrolase domain-containing protein [Gemmatimonas sp.]|uniref:serine hydrolase domain-containing protein n=1 Tax=Gemmatimonas sp. TaxID=1962908 RepID=UPI002ED82AB8